jgi:Domain of unknown function (DUF4252)
MYRFPSRVFLILMSFSFVLTACRKEISSDVLAKHEKAYPELRKKYVYQSLIRLANIKHDPDFEKLIKDVRKITLYMPPSEDSTYQIKDLRTGMRGDGYEELVDVRTKDAQRISLWVRDSDARPHYLALLDSEKEDLILEIDGQLNLQYLSAINVADQGSLMDLLQGGF